MVNKPSVFAPLKFYCSVDPDKNLHSAASELGVHHLHMSLSKWGSDLTRVDYVFVPLGHRKYAVAVLRLYCYGI